MSTILALICIIVGFIVGAANADLWFGAQTWFLAAIAFALLQLPGIGSFVVRRSE